MRRRSVEGPPTVGVLSLPVSHWKQLYDVRWPGRPDGAIDHVLVGPSGVYVIRYRSASASLVTSDGQGLHDAGWSLDAAVEESSDAADAVAGLLPARYRSRVRPVICFREDEPLADLVGDVMVTSLMALEHIVRSSPIMLSTSEVVGVFASLDARLEPVPAVPAPLRSRWSRLRKPLAQGVVAAAAVGLVAAGPGLLELSGRW